MPRVNFFKKTHRALISACSSDPDSTFPISSGLVLLPILVGWILYFYLEKFVTKGEILRSGNTADGHLIYLSVIFVYFVLCTIVTRKWRSLEKFTNILDFSALASYFVYYLATQKPFQEENFPENNSIMYWEGMTLEFIVIAGTIALKKLSLKIIFFLGINIYMLTLKMNTWEDRLYSFKLAGTLASTVILFFVYRKQPQSQSQSQPQPQPLPQSPPCSPREFSNESNVFRQVMDYSEKGIAIISKDWQLLYKNDAFVNFVYSEIEEDCDFEQALAKVTGCALQIPQDEFSVRGSIPTSDQPLLRATTDRLGRQKSKKTPNKRSLFGSIIGEFKRSNTKTKNPERPNLYEVIQKALKENMITIVTSPRSTDRQSSVNTYLAQLNDTKTIQIKVRPVEDQEIQGVIVTISDYTINEKYNNLLANEKMQTRSLAAVTHELRAPLTSTVQFLETASSNDKIPEEAKINNLEPAMQNINYMLILVNDILDHAQIKENRLKLTYAKTNVLKLVEEASAIISISAKNKKLHYSVNYLGTIPEDFFTDPNRLKQILVNLLSNAVKFTMKGSIRLTIEATSDKWISFSVKDTGIGIKPEDMKKLFQEYGKLDLGEKQLLNLNGVGLGLNISNKLVKALSDENLGIIPESGYNKGSTFSFRIKNKFSAMQEQTTYTKSMTKADSTSVPRINSLYYRGTTQDDRSSTFTQLRTIKTNKTLLKKKFPEDYNSTYSLKEKNNNSYLSSNHIELALEEKSDEENFGEMANERVEGAGSSYQKKSLLPVFPNESNFSSSPQSAGKKDQLESKGNIFLIDDDQYILMATAQIIHNMGIGCLQFFDIEEAIRQILYTIKENNGRNYPALMLIDYNMPYYTGAELAKMIRLIEKLNNMVPTVIIGLTGAGDNIDIQNVCMESGMDEVYEKPLTKEKLSGILDKFAL